VETRNVEIKRTKELIRVFCAEKCKMLNALSLEQEPRFSRR